MKLINLVGKRFGRLTVIERYGYQGKIITWLCKCDCGNSCIVRGDHLKDLSISSCGCLTKELRITNATKHSLSGTRLYRIYNCMKNRCYDKKHKHYKNYGGRGITICDEWLNSYISFKTWAESNGYDWEAPRGQCTLDRKDVNGDYCPENCRWSDMKTQSNNRRNSK